MYKSREYAYNKHEATVLYLSLFLLGRGAVYCKIFEFIAGGKRTTRERVISDSFAFSGAMESRPVDLLTVIGPFLTSLSRTGSVTLI